MPLTVAEVGFAPHEVPYERAWAMQRELHARRVADEVGDTCLLLEHPPTYTAGRRTNSWERPTDGTPVVEVDRGGRITWHGPGQLTGYPIVKLPALGGGDGSRPGTVDVVAYVRRLEQALIGVCAEHGVRGERVEGRTGVWVRTPEGPPAKVAAIGVRVARGVTMHGFALNADCDLSWFGRIVPCGISDAGVTSLTALTGRPVGVTDLLPAVTRHLRAVLDEPAPARGAA